VDLGAERVAAGPAGKLGEWAGGRMVHIELFLYLQLLDFMTTLIGMRLGLGEASPFVRHLMKTDPTMGLLVSKLVAFALAGVCVWLNKRHVVRWINYWYAVLVVWNMVLIAMTLRPV
jgi:hypothetical protein